MKLNYEKNVSKEICLEYLKVLIDDNKYLNTRMFPDLKECIVEVCSNLIVNDTYPNRDCLILSYDGIGFSYYNSIKTNSELVYYFAKIILDEENKEYSNLDFFKLKHDVSGLKRAIETLSSLNGIHR